MGKKKKEINNKLNLVHKSFHRKIPIKTEET